MGARRSFLPKPVLPKAALLKSVLVLVVLSATLFLARRVCLAGIGAALVHDDGAAKADIAVVLAGDYFGYRLTTGANLVKQGYVPHVLVSGPPGIYGINEADAAIQFALRKGYPAEWFIPLRNTAFSTRDESVAVLDWLQANKIHSFLLVTSNFHSARARRIYLQKERERGGGPNLRVVISGDRFFDVDNWWHNREGQKTVLLEWTKTVTAVFGI